MEHIRTIIPGVVANLFGFDDEDMAEAEAEASRLRESGNIFVTDEGDMRNG